MKINERKITPFYRLVCAFLPERCPFCDDPVIPGKLFCDKCKKKIKFVHFCKGVKGGFPCVSTFPYDDHYKAAVIRFKFHQRKQYAYQMARMMAITILLEYSQENFDMITYVPLHKERLKERGYNQCELLSAELSKILNIPSVPTLIKTKHTKPQHTISKLKERQENVKNAYKVIDKNQVNGKRILLIDDIVTTGNTIGECASVLDKSGARAVFCASFALTTVKTT